ncbi:MAG TPA: A24 family peptidase [Candidatus Nanoarchaeia archaeon]|nr:A24 family peptidase [Candidatus Nanoarchaeia archaeon]
MVTLDILLASVAVLGLGAATIHDLRTREVPDWITYSMIIAGFGIRIIGALGPESWQYIASAFIGLAITYALGSVMYYAKQWGGGDAKMMMALGVLFATRPDFVRETAMPFLGEIFINILMVGALYGLLWGFVLAWKQRKKFTLVARQMLQERKMIKIRMIAIGGAVAIMFVAFNVQDVFIKITIMTFSLLVLLYPYLWIYVKSVEKTCLYKYVTPKELTEGDWVEEDILVNKRVVYKVKNTGIEKEDIQKLIRAKVKRVLVKEGIPFIPPFLIGTVLALLQISFLNFF